ncbi:polysaccharide biosynthesis protein [Halorubrum sp. Ib24]|uniref:oligosaccharide flippase family protein n=1 Tax=Halorubrum sp. Ib24 TaxID=1383850 RepID=UPI000B98B994|nr:oligosaccharide flippase family protein [Halorubrum sp. Ib24]OYR41812.1 polysaccharide biosynthesis protein [Halorubrum sp. Ib24]
MKRTFASAFLSVVGGKFVIVAAAVFITPLLVRLLGEDAYGQYATLMAMFGLLMILVSSGVNSGTRKFISEERDADRWKDHVFGFYFRFAALFAFLGSALLVGAAQIGLVDAALGEEFAGYASVLGLLVFASQFGEYARRVLMGLKLEHVSEPIGVVHKVSFGAFAVAFVYFDYGVLGVLLGHLVARVIEIALSLYFISKRLSLASVFTPTPASFPRSRLLSFNHLSVVYIFLLTSLYHVDVLMLERFTASAQVGYYKIALVIAEFLWFVPRALQSVIIQSTSNLWAEGKTERVTRLSSAITRYTLVLTMLLAVGLAVLARDVVPLYAGPAYVASVPPLLLLLPGTIGFAIARPILAVSHAKGDLRVMIAATGLSALINVALNALLIPTYGIEGAAIATSVGYGSLPLFHVAGARRLGYRPLSDLRLGRVAVAAGATGAVIHPLANAIAGTLPTLALVPPTGFVVYVAVAIATRLVTLDEVKRGVAGLPDPVGARATSLVERVVD